MVTLRGSQRPLGPNWSRPYLPPLSRLDDTSSKALFLDTCDLAEDGATLDQLLAPLDGHPLAVTLMAQIAQYQPVTFLLDQYHAEGPSMLSIGDDRTTDLRTSFECWLASPRVTETPHVMDVLLILVHANFSVSRSHLCSLSGISSPQKCISTLRQSCIVIEDTCGQLHLSSLIKNYLIHRTL